MDVHLELIYLHYFVLQVKIGILELDDFIQKTNTLEFEELADLFTYRIGCCTEALLLHKIHPNNVTRVCCLYHYIVLYISMFTIYLHANKIYDANYMVF